VSQPLFFFDVTRAARDPHLASLLHAFGCERWASRPLPTERPGLVLDYEGVRLFSPGIKPQYWHPGMAHLRLKRDHDPLRTALNCKAGDSVLDCTMGMGHDAMVLSAVGIRVTALEMCAPLLLYSNQGMWCYRPDLAQNISVRRTDYRTALAGYPDNSFDAVYLDPMFDQSAQELKGFTWSMMRHIGLANVRYTHADIEHAYRVARSSVVLKLSPTEPRPQLPSLPDCQLGGSRRVKFAKWRVNSLGLG
jgi:hypothetical protein